MRMYATLLRPEYVFYMCKADIASYGKYSKL